MLFILLSSTFPWLPLLPLPPSLTSPSFPLSPLSSQLLLLCCKIQLPNWFNFLPFRTLLTYFPCRHSISLYLPLSLSLSCLPSLSCSCLSSRPRWAADNWMIWIFILNLLPYTELVPRSSFLRPSPFHSHAYISVLCPRGFSYFSLLPFFTAIFACCFFCVDIFSIKMEIVGELENCLSIGQRLQYASRIKRSCKLNMVGEREECIGANLIPTPPSGTLLPLFSALPPAVYAAIKN